MFKFKHTTLIVIAGFIWMGVGIFLLNMGLRLIALNVLTHDPNASQSLLGFFASLFGGKDEAAVAIIAIGMAVGYFKGRFVLAKTVKRMVDRIRAIPQPVSFYRIYGIKFYILIAIMIGLGATIRLLNTPGDIRGAVDIVIGSALINGALIYFRYAALTKKEAAATAKSLN